MGGQNDKVIYEFSNYLGYFQKKSKIKNFGESKASPRSLNGFATTS